MPELNSKLENNKVLVSLNLKVPIQFEIELQPMENRDYSSVDDSANLKKANIASLNNASANFIMNEINNSQINEQLEVLSNQIANHILKNNPNQLVSDNSDTQLSLNNYNNQEEKLEALFVNNSHNQENLTVKKRKLRIADSLNDSLTLAVNCVGAILFMGKLANYSWE